MKYSQLLSINSDAKTIKGVSRGFLTGVMYLAPSTLSGKNVCAFATPGCIASCLNTAGRGRFTSTQEARIRKTQYFTNCRQEFMLNLVNSIEKLIRKADREGLIPVVRLNGTSDIPWENVLCRRDNDGKKINIFQAFPEITFYDYTKNPHRANLPANYTLTFSRAESNEHNCEQAFANGMNVAVVFMTANYPEQFLGHPVVNGDDNDLRFLDKPGSVIGLYAKGDAKKDTSGFVVATN